MKNNKKGFTLLELVIVIAIVAILAAVLIPTFVGVINRSKLSNDIMLCKNLNTSATTIEADENKPSTMTENLKLMAENGFNVDKIKASNPDNIFVYDSVNNRFFVYDYVKDAITYKDENTTINMTDKAHKVNYWIISETYEQTNDNLKGFSVCLKDNYSGETSLTISTGLDVGNNSNISSINYTNTGAKQDVVICTNGGTLTVNAPVDNVKHYGYAESVNVINVHTSSYHENGTVKFIEVSAGHIVLEKESDVSAVHFTATNGEFKNADNKTISIDLSNVNANGIAFSRDAVTIDANGTYVAEVKTETTEYVWLFGNGIKEQMVATTTEGAIAENGTLKTGITAGAEDGSVAEQIANPAKRNDQGKLVDENNDVIDLTEVDLTKSDAFENIDVQVEEVADKESVQIGATLFVGGTGTESNPFLIVDYDTMQKVSEVYYNTFSYGVNYYYNLKDNNGNWVCDTIEDAEAMAIANGYNRNNNGPFYFKVKDGISAIDCNQDGRSWIPVELLGYFDGNGVIFNNVDKGLFRSANGEEVIIKNFTINANISVSGGIGAVVYNSNTCNLTIDSVDVHGTIIGANWVTPYVQFGPGPSYAWNLTIKNSVSDATLVATSGPASGFVGHPYDDVSNGSVNGASLITIIDSAYIGNMSTTGELTSTNFKYFTINGNDNRIKTLYSEEFIEKLSFNPEGTLYGVPADKSGYPVVVNEDGSKVFFCGNSGKNVVDNYKIAENKAKLNTTAKSSLPANIGDVFTITKISGASKAVISLQIAPNDKNNYGSYLGTYMSEEIDVSNVASGSTFTSEEVRYFTININSEVTTKTGVSGNIFNVVNSYYGKNAHNGATVKIVQFDANGNVLNITSIQIAKHHDAE